MTDLPDDIRAAATPEEAARRLGAALGLGGPAPIPATERALADPLFARALWATRKLPAMRDRMLADPTTAKVGAAPSETPSAAKLAGKAAGAVLKWGMDGLRHAEPWVIERRLAAFYRGGATFELASNPGGRGALARLVLPVEVVR